MGRIADIARVQDAVDTFESLQRLGAEQAVRIRDDADASLHGRLAFCGHGGRSCSVA